MKRHILNLEKISVALLFVLIISFGAFTFYLQIHLVQAVKELQNLELERSKSYASKISSEIIRFISDKNLSKSGQLVDISGELSHMLETYKTEEYRYMYLLTKDSKKRFRFVADAVDAQRSRMDPMQLFFPGNAAFSLYYDSGKVGVANVTDDNGKIWRSLLYPIRSNDGQIRFMLVLELSKAYIWTMQKILKPLHLMTVVMASILTGSFFALIFALIMVKKVRDKIYKDPLTGYYTMAYIQRKATMDTRSKRMALMVVPVHFQRFKERYGKSGAEIFIRRFAEHLGTVFSGKGIIARTVDAEFFVFCTKFEKNATTEEYLEDLHQKSENFHFVYDGEKIETPVLMSAVQFKGRKESYLQVEALQKFLDEKILELQLQAKEKKKKICLVRQDAIESLK